MSLQQKNEATYKESDYGQWRYIYEANQSWRTHSNEELLLIAKAYFIEEQYDRCIKILQGIPLAQSTKILYEKTCFLFKANYLRDSDGIYSKQKKQRLLNILKDFDKTLGKAKGPKVQSYHLKVIQEFKQFAESIPAESHFVIQIQNNFKDVEEKYLSEPIFEGFPCYFIPREWSRKFTKEIEFLPKLSSSKNKEQTRQKVKFKYPGPLTHFAIVNQIFECVPHEDQKKEYLSKVLFPCQKFVLISKRYFEYLNEKYNTQTKLTPIRRLYKKAKFQDQRGGSYINRNLNYISTTSYPIQYRDRLQIFQFPMNADYKTSVLPLIRGKFGFGQLKKKLQPSKIVENPPEVYQVFCPKSQNTNYSILKFVKLPEPKVITSNSKQVATLVSNFDLQTYQKSNNNNQQIGLDNLGNSCYMSSSIQCLNHTHEFHKYLLETYLLDQINYTKCSGEVVCALADLFKRMWLAKNQTAIRPEIFKETFGRRVDQFAGKTQQDAHQYLNFVLNSVHDDLNRKGSISFRRETLHNTNDLQTVKSNVLSHYENQNDTIISRMMKGSLYNQIKCRSCSATSYTFDIFLILSLPLPIKDIKTIIVNYVGCEKQNCEAKQYKINAKKVTSLGILFQIVKKAASKSPNRLYLIVAVNKKSKKVEQIFSENQSEIKGADFSKFQQLESTCQFYFYEIEKKEESQNNKHLTIIYYQYDSDKIGFPRIKYVDIQALRKSKEDRIKFASNAIPESVFRFYMYSNQRAAQKIDQVSIQPAFGSKFEYSIKIDLKTKLLIEVTDFEDNILQSQNEDKCTLQDCFELHSKTQTIELQQGWKCEKCKKVTAAQKRQRIYQSKNILIISFQRFKAGQKNTLKINYPLKDLDISKWVHSSEQFSFLSSSNRYLYDLYAVCLHFGSLDRGHYVSFCKNHANQKWYRFDDELVYELEEKDIIHDSAYILFYRRRNMI